MIKPVQKQLTDFEKQVTERKGTEAPFTGQYVAYNESGTYLCKRCEAPLFLSEHKFDSHCGWPSFDNEVPGSVTKIPDADGKRTEIICTGCGSHLGHVFSGEGYTSKNLRHCVNSISLIFRPAAGLQKSTALFASGCFWGTEFHFAKAVGVLHTRVGFAGGTLKNPSYREVCEGNTGHLEVVEVEFDSQKTSYSKLLQLFFETHDFSQTNGQGPDIGSQYLSAIFALNESQEMAAKAAVSWLQSNHFQVATQIKAPAEFFPAEEKHQKYYFKQASNPYCHIYRKVFPDGLDFDEKEKS